MGGAFEETLLLSMVCNRGSTVLFPHLFAFPTTASSMAFTKFLLPPLFCGFLSRSTTRRREGETSVAVPAAGTGLSALLIGRWAEERGEGREGGGGGDEESVVVFLLSTTEVAGTALSALLIGRWAEERGEGNERGGGGEESVDVFLLSITDVRVLMLLEECRDIKSETSGGSMPSMASMASMMWRFLEKAGGVETVGTTSPFKRVAWVVGLNACWVVAVESSSYELIVATTTLFARPDVGAWFCGALYGLVAEARQGGGEEEEAVVVVVVLSTTVLLLAVGVESNPMQGFGLLKSLRSLAKPVVKVEEFGGGSVVVIVVGSLNERYFITMELDRTLVIFPRVFAVVAIGGALTSQWFTASSVKPLGTLLGNGNHFIHASVATN